MYFESHHSLNEHEFHMRFGKNLRFPVLHIHRSFEFYAQVNGTSRVTVGEKTYILQEGEAVLILPFQPHSYAPIEEGEYAICFFSPALVQDFYKKNRIQNAFKQYLYLSLYLIPLTVSFTP